MGSLRFIQDLASMMTSGRRLFFLLLFHFLLFSFLLFGSADLEAMDGVGVADVVLHQACLVSWDGGRVRDQLDAPPPRGRQRLQAGGK